MKNDTGTGPNVTPLYTMGSNADLSPSSQEDIEINQKQKEDDAADLEVPVPKTKEENKFPKRKKNTNYTYKDVMKLLATITDDHHE